MNSIMYFGIKSVQIIICIIYVFVVWPSESTDIVNIRPKIGFPEFQYPTWTWCGYFGRLWDVRPVVKPKLPCNDHPPATCIYSDYSFSYSSYDDSWKDRPAYHVWNYDKQLDFWNDYCCWDFQEYPRRIVWKARTHIFYFDFMYPFCHSLFYKMKIRTDYESYHGHYENNEIWIPGSIVTTTIELVYAEWKYNTTHAFNFTVPKFPHCDANYFYISSSRMNGKNEKCICEEDFLRVSCADGWFEFCDDYTNFGFMCYNGPRETEVQINFITRTNKNVRWAWGLHLQISPAKCSDDHLWRSSNGKPEHRNKYTRLEPASSSGMREVMHTGKTTKSRDDNKLLKLHEDDDIVDLLAIPQDSYHWTKEGEDL